MFGVVLHGASKVGMDAAWLEGGWDPSIFCKQSCHFPPKASGRDSTSLSTSLSDFCKLT